MQALVKNFKKSGKITDQVEIEIKAWTLHYKMAGRVIFEKPEGNKKLWKFTKKTGQDVKFVKKYIIKVYRGSVLVMEDGNAFTLHSVLNRDFRPPKK